MNDSAVQAIEADPVFHELVRLKSRLSWGFAALTILVFFGYLAVIALMPDYIGRAFSEGGVLTNGIVYGVLVVACAIVFTGAYVVISNGSIDRLSAQLRKKVSA